jgi:hypothetical protein
MVGGPVYISFEEATCTVEGSPNVDGAINVSWNTILASSVNRGNPHPSYKRKLFAPTQPRQP